METMESKQREAQATKYREQAMIDINEGIKQKDTATWLNLVNDPSSYYAVREMIGLKGIDMTVEHFEELAALFIHLAHKATRRSIQQKAAGENNR